MSVMQLAYGTAVSLTFSGLNSLAAGAAVGSSAIDNSTVLADDYLVEITIADISESGNKQVLVFAASSVDNSVYSDTALSNLRRLGFIDVTGTGPQTMALASLAAAFGGVVPKYTKIVVYNDAGVSLASSGNSGRIVPITWTAT